MRAAQNRAWRKVRALAQPMLTVVKALGHVPMAELLVSRTLAESQDKYNVLTLLVSVTTPVFLYNTICYFNLLGTL